ncbi:MAG: hypothetical protein IIA48_06520 [Bacteroidetes bacterium]|nr:hypothetical protein [Bacteroidota bacterium]
MQSNKIVLFPISIDELEDLIRKIISAEINKKKVEDLMDFKQTCVFLRISTSTLNVWKAKDMVPFRRLGKRIYFSRTEILQVLKNSNYARIKELIND